MNKRIIIAVLVAAVVILGGGIWYVVEKTRPQADRPDTASNGTAPDNEADWQTYTDSERNFSFTYPPGWSVTKNENGAVAQPANLADPWYEPIVIFFHERGEQTLREWVADRYEEMPGITTREISQAKLSTMEACDISCHYHVLVTDTIVSLSPVDLPPDPARANEVIRTIALSIREASAEGDNQAGGAEAEWQKDWSKEYGVSFNYPQEWEQKYNKDDTKVLFYSPARVATKGGNDDFVPPPTVAVTVEEDVLMEEFITKDQPCFQDVQDVTINSFQAKRYNYTCTMVHSENHAFSINGNVIHFSSYLGPDEVEDKEQVEKMMSTLISTKVAEWQTYSNEEYGFEFKYPLEWEESDSNPLFVKIYSYQSTPEVLGPNDLATSFTKGQLQELKRAIESGDKEGLTMVGLKNAELTIGYDSPGGVFYKKIRFFVNNDLVEVFVLLPINSFSGVTGEKEVNKIVSALKDRSVDGETMKIFDIFDVILSTFRFANDGQSINSGEWQTYRNEDYGFELQYPKTWRSEKSDDSNYNGEGPYVLYLITNRHPVERYPFIAIRENWSADKEIAKINSSDPPFTKVLNVKDVVLGTISAKQVTYATTMGLDFQKTIVSQDGATVLMFDSFPDDNDFADVISTFTFTE